ncbi:hypothetical protein [Rhizobium sp. 22-785-1]
MTDDTPKSAGRKLMMFGVATFLWLAIAIYLGYFAHNPENNCVGTFKCLTANEWGDFLAGVFAPIAFLWLVATVWIQSDELREQRKELALTRNEFELNRKVMIEQAEEARKQAEYISTQTQFLAEEAHARKRQETLTSFTILVGRFVEYTREYAEESFYRSGSFTGKFLREGIERGSDEKYIYEQCDWIESSIDATGSNLEVLKPEIFENSFTFIYSAEELVEKLPYHSRVSWKRSKIKSYLDVCGKIINNSSQFVHLKSHVVARERRLNAMLDNSDLTFANKGD